MTSSCTREFFQLPNSAKMILNFSKKDYVKLWINLIRLSVPCTKDRKIAFTQEIWLYIRYCLVI